MSLKPQSVSSLLRIFVGFFFFFASLLHSSDSEHEGWGLSVLLGIGKWNNNSILNLWERGMPSPQPGPDLSLQNLLSFKCCTVLAIKYGCICRQRGIEASMVNNNCAYKLSCHLWYLLMQLLGEQRAADASSVLLWMCPQHHQSFSFGFSTSTMLLHFDSVVYWFAFLEVSGEIFFSENTVFSL